MLQQPQEARPEVGSLSTRGACASLARVGLRCPQPPPVSGTQDPSNHWPRQRHELTSYRQGEGSCQRTGRQRTHPGAWGQQESQREGESLPSGPRDSERTWVPLQERQLVRDTPALSAAANLASGRFSFFSPGTGGILCHVSSKLCPEALTD